MPTLLENILRLNSLTQAEVCRQVDIPECRFSLLMNRKAKPYKTEQAKLEKWFETDIHQLLGESTDAD